jgi:murein DD-endopeptidase MepM/ murein hydrolase activator NlpD
VSRTGLYTTQLELYRCGVAQGQGLDVRADPAARSRQARIDADGRRFVRPVAGAITQFLQGAHTGVDIAAPYGSPVVATDAGTVSDVGWRGPGGLAVCVYQDWGLETCAYHLSSTYVDVGERVVAGQSIAAIGSSGESTGPHVHWEARTNGALVDPLTYAPVVTKPVIGGATGSP